MSAFFSGLFSSGSFIPHGHCYLWKPELVWLHIVSDAGIMIAYYAIPIILFYFIRKRQDTPFSWVFGLFSAFIFACGTTHLANIWTLWHPTYWLSGTLKAATASVSIFTAIALFPVAAKAITLPSTKQLEAVNQELQKEIIERQQAEARIQTLNTELDQRIQERTAELKQINQELTQEKERYQTLVVASSQFVWISDPQGNTQRTSDEWLNATGQREADARELGWLEAVHPADRDRTKRVWQHAVNTQTQYEVDYRLKTAKGDDRNMFVRGVPVLEANGQVREWVGTCTDITDRKQAEQQIRQLNTSLEAQNRSLEALVEQRTAELVTFINALPDYIFVVERDTLRIPFCNDRLATTTGATNRFEVQGKTVSECFPADHAAYFIEQNRQVFETGKTLHVQEILNLPTGILHLDTYKIPLKHPSGETYALIGSSRDITELVKARQALTKRTQQLEATNQELKSFSYSVSHDLRAPLRHINGFVAALTKQLTQQHAIDDPKVAHYLQVIADSSNRMGQLIDGLLALSRLGRRIEPQPVALAPLVEQAIRLIQSDRQSEGTIFEVAPLPTVYGDAAMLQQIFSNLIDNAVKFSYHRTPAHIQIGSTQDDVVFIRDNGIGFDQARADQLFQAFQQLNHRDQFEGTGIGLAIVQRIIHQHGGTVWAEGEVDRGACFYFKLAAEPEV